MGDARRLGGVVFATAFVSPCLAFREGVLGASTRWWPTWLEDDWPTTEYRASPWIGAQVAGLVKEGYAEGRPIGVLIGASQQGFAADRPPLETEVEPRLKWLRLSVYAGSLRPRRGPPRAEPSGKVLASWSAGSVQGTAQLAVEISFKTRPRPDRTSLS